MAGNFYLHNMFITVREPSEYIAYDSCAPGVAQKHYYIAVWDMRKNTFMINNPIGSSAPTLPPKLMLMPQVLAGLLSFTARLLVSHIYIQS